MDPLGQTIPQQPLHIGDPSSFASKPSESIPAESALVVPHNSATNPGWFGGIANKARNVANTVGNIYYGTQMAIAFARDPKKTAAELIAQLQSPQVQKPVIEKVVALLAQQFPGSQTIDEIATIIRAAPDTGFVPAITDLAHLGVAAGVKQGVNLASNPENQKKAWNAILEQIQQRYSGETVDKILESLRTAPNYSVLAQNLAGVLLPKATSKDAEEQIAAVVAKYWYKAADPVSLDLFPEEVDIDKVFAKSPHTQRYGEMADKLSDHFLQLMDEHVVDAREKAKKGTWYALEIGGEGVNPSNLQLSEEVLQHPEKQDFVLLPTLPGPGQMIWIKRNRAQLKCEMIHSVKIALLNLRDRMRVTCNENPLFTKDLLADVFKVLDQHMGHYTRYVAYQQKNSELDPNTFDHHHVKTVWGNQMHWALEEGTKQQRLQHSEALSTALHDVLFPNGYKQLPIPLHYRQVMFEVILPKIGGGTIDKVMASLVDKRVINRVLLDVLNSLPKPGELQASQHTKKTNVPVDPALRDAAGRFLVNMLKVGEPSLASLFDDKLEAVNKLFGLPKDIFRIQVEERMGELIGAAVEKWLKQFSTNGKFDPDKMLDWTMNVFLDSYLNTKLDPNYKGPGQVSDEQVIERLVEVRENLGPYIIQTFRLAVNGVQNLISSKLDRAIHHIPLLPTIKSGLEQVYNLLAGAFGDIFSFVVSKVYHFLQWDKIDHIILHQHAENQAKDLLRHLHQNAAHENVVRKLFDTMVESITGAEILRPGAEQEVESANDGGNSNAST